jgi:hypothetical protein
MLCRHHGAGRGLAQLHRASEHQGHVVLHNRVEDQRREQCIKEPAQDELETPGLTARAPSPGISVGESRSHPGRSGSLAHGALGSL